MVISWSKLVFKLQQYYFDDLPNFDGVRKGCQKLDMRYGCFDDHVCGQTEFESIIKG